MSIHSMNNPNPGVSSLLTSYMQYVSDEGIDLGRFVEQGGRLVGREEAGGLAGNFAELREKIASLSKEHPRLSRQLGFLADLFAFNPALLTEAERNETAFVLLYAVKEMDMMPDHVPEVGYLDDAAVTEVVLSRHAETFERLCLARNLDWAALKPEIGK